MTEAAKQIEDELNRKEFPSVDLAYPLALSSYEVAQKRLDAVHERIQTLMAFAVTLSLAIPVVTATRGLHFRSVWFIAAGLAFFAAIVVGTIARLVGHLKVINPKTLYDNYLDCSEWEFKKETIRWAGQNYEANRNLVNFKGRLASFTAALFFVEAVLLAVWAASGSS